MIEFRNTLKLFSNIVDSFGTYIITVNLYSALFIYAGLFIDVLGAYFLSILIWFFAERSKGMK